MKPGAADVLTRPINTEHLVRAVLEALRQDVHVGAVEGGGRPVEVRDLAQLTR
jgi:two-component system, LuxR family, response regulator FixJ